MEVLHKIFMLDVHTCISGNTTNNTGGKKCNSYI